MHRIREAVFVLLCTLWLPFANAQHATVPDADSLGNLWVVTADMSGSMVPGKNKSARVPAMAKNVMKSLQGCVPLDQIDFAKDRFLFFTSGYRFCPLRKGEPGFDSCFIHHTDACLHVFASKQELIADIGHLLANSEYSYQLSFVSQIETFSLVKASRFLKQREIGPQFKSIVLLTLTDDAEGTPQWRMDLKNIKFWDPQKAQEVSDATQHYVYNELTGTGAGKIDEIYYDDKGHVHIKVSDCQSLMSRPQENAAGDLFEISARDGKTVTLKFPANYQGHPIAIYYIDSLAVNGEMYKLNKCYPADMGTATLNIDYANEAHENRFELFGKLQIVYEDPIFGEHYRKVSFSQQAHLMSKTMINHIVYAIITAVLVLALIIWIFFFFIPNRKLVALYALGKKYEVRRGYRWNWKKNGTQLFAFQPGKNELKWLVCAHVPMVKVFETPQASKTGVTIFSSKAINFVEDESELKRRNLPVAQCEFELSYDRKKRQYCYELKKIEAYGFIAFMLPKVRKIAFIQVVEPESILRRYLGAFEYDALSKHFMLPPEKRSDALVCEAVSDNDVIWSVLLPEYDDGVEMPLLRVRRLFAFRQKGGAAVAPQNVLAQLLIAQVKKYQTKCKKINYEFYPSSLSYQFSLSEHPEYQFEMVDSPCHGFICLREDTENHPHCQVLYSPMGEHGLQQEIQVTTPKLRTGKGFIYQTFLPFPVLKKLPAQNRVGLVYRFNQMISFNEARNYESVFFERNTISYNIVQSKLFK